MCLLCLLFPVEVGAQVQAALGEAQQATGFHQVVKEKFIEGNAGFMSLVAITLVLGLALCIERIIYLSLADIDAKRLLTGIDDALQRGDVEQAKTLCRDDPGTGSVHLLPGTDACR